jgi:hypothetical protein
VQHGKLVLTVKHADLQQNHIKQDFLPILKINLTQKTLFEIQKPASEASKSKMRWDLQEEI